MSIDRNPHFFHYQFILFFFVCSFHPSKKKSISSVYVLGYSSDSSSICQQDEREFQKF
jgi:hypothetical protein